MSSHKLKNSIGSFGINKNHGPEGTSIEFYKPCWHIIDKDSTSLFQEMSKISTIASKMKHGFITLVHKKEARNIINN